MDPITGADPGGALGAEAPPPSAKSTYRTYGGLIAVAPPFKPKMYDFTQKSHLFEAVSISGVLFMSATRWSRSRQFCGRGFVKWSVVSKFSRASRAIIIFSTPLMQVLDPPLYQL